MSEGLEAPEQDLESSLSSATSDTPMVDGDGEVVASGEASSYEQAAAPSASPAESWTGVVDYARSQGYQLPYTDDVQAIQGLLQAYRQSQERNWYTDFGRQVAPYADQVQAWISQQQAQRAVPQQQDDPTAQPPWMDQWAQMVERDPQTGIIRSKPGYDPAIAQKVQTFLDWKQKWDNDPKFRDEYVERRAEVRAKDLIQKEFASHRESLAAESLVGQNANWIFQTYEDGRPVVGQDGMKVLSPAGRVYAQAVNEIWKSGVRDVNRCNQMAMMQVQNVVLRQQMLQYQQAYSNQAQQSQGQVTPNVGGSATRPAQVPAPGRQKKQGLSIREALNQATTGFSDEDTF
jgi:hypothetical protein